MNTTLLNAFTDELEKLSRENDPFWMDKEASKREAVREAVSIMRTGQAAAKKSIRRMGGNPEGVAGVRYNLRHPLKGFRDQVSFLRRNPVKKMKRIRKAQNEAMAQKIRELSRR